MALAPARFAELAAEGHSGVLAATAKQIPRTRLEETAPPEPAPHRKNEPKKPSPGRS
jgi:hypothetical protein